MHAKTLMVQDVLNVTIHNVKDVNLDGILIMENATIVKNLQIVINVT